MHVLQLGPYPPPEGGINRNILAIRDELRGAGHRCSIIATSHSTAIGDEPDVFHPTSPFDFLRRVRSIPSDIVHLHIGGDITSRVLGLTLAVALLGRGRKILSFHSGGYPTTAAGMAARRMSIRGAFFRLYDRVIAVNPLIAEVFARYGATTDVIYPYVHRLPDSNDEMRDDLKTLAESRSPFLLTVGLLEPEYDLAMQIDAMESVLEQFPNAGLMIVGSGSLEGSLRDAIDSKPYRANILLAGDVEHRQTLHLISRCDALLRTTIYDGDAISVREALFLDTPVIATDNGMRPDGVRLIAAGDKSALVDAVIETAQQKRVKRPPDRDDPSNIKSVLKVYEEVLR